MVHRIVAETFLPNENSHFSIVNHKDGNKVNNHVDNLEWCDYSINNGHAYDLGLNPKFENHPRSKLKNSEVIEIRRLRQENMLTSTELASMFNVSTTTIKDIVNKKIWKGL